MDNPSSTEEYVNRLAERLRYAYRLAREAMVKAREEQQKQYNKRAKLLNYKVGDMVLLKKRVVEENENRKLCVNWTGPWRVILVYEGSNLVDTANNSYVPNKVNVNNIKPIFQSQLWRDTEYTKFDPAEQIVRHFHNHVSTQTTSSSFLAIESPSNSPPPKQQPVHKPNDDPLLPLTEQPPVATAETSDSLEPAQDTLRVPAIVKSYFKKLKVMSDKARKKEKKKRLSNFLVNQQKEFAQESKQQHQLHVVVRVGQGNSRRQLLRIKLLSTRKRQHGNKHRFHRKRRKDSLNNNSTMISLPTPSRSIAKEADRRLQ